MNTAAQDGSHAREAPPGTLGTVHNAVTLLRLLAEGPAYQPLTDLAARSGMAVPTVHRLLRSLVVAGFVEQDPTSSRYGLHRRFHRRTCPPSLVQSCTATWPLVHLSA